LRQGILVAGRLADCELDLGLAQHVDDLFGFEVPSPHCRTPGLQ
jgi:hypothetical protein